MSRNDSSIRRAVAVGLLCAMAGGTLAADAGSTARAAASPAPLELVKDPRARAALKAMSDRLAAATSFPVRTRNIVPMVGPNGQWVSLIGESSVALQCPDKLFVERGGDQASMNG